jgi:hypothetical protein
VHILPILLIPFICSVSSRPESGAEKRRIAAYI